jgi:serine/threonine protein kinase/tetratricopeptide (TPR) repeat protein
MPQPEKVWDDDRLISLVDAALAQPPREREAWLRLECGGDSPLFDQAREYIESEERMGGFLLEPFCTMEVFDPVLEPGDLLEGRFRIVREVGEGGMAIVYQALDKKLGKGIAIKCAKPGFETRLTPEVRHATEIAHRNVCKIFDFHSAGTDHGEIDFITMEFLDGPTLTERLRAGPLPEREARDIALQLCAGLAAAHRNQVIHGDLKSNNIILTTAVDGKLRAVITDFGLARGKQPQPEDAHPGGLASAVGGAPDYMAPELRNGEKPSVASDIYALGCICYEMLSGTRLREPGAPGQESGKRKIHRVHPKWDGLLARFLDPDPARRFRSVEEIETDLLPPSRGLMLAAAAGVVLAVITGGVTYLRTATPPETVRLAVLPFETDPANRALSDGLVNETAARLRQVKNTRTRRLTIIPLDAAIQNQLDQPEKAIRLLGSTHVLYGSLRRDAGRTLIHAYLTGTTAQSALSDWQAGFEPGEVQGVPVALAGLVTATLRLAPLAVAPTVNAEAFTDFTRGIGLLARNATDKAIPLLENAVKADPNSPLTHARLAEAQILKYWSTNNALWMQRAILSLGDARQHNPDVVEVWSVSGLINYYRGLYEAAEMDLRRALQIEPQNGDTWRRLGMVYHSNERFDEALSAYRKAIQMQPSYFRNYQDLCSLLNDEAKYQEAIVECTQMVALAPELSESYYARANPYFNWGHYAEAETDLRAALQLAPDSSRATQLLASSLAYEGRYTEAVALFQQAIATGPETYLLYLNFGQTLRWAGLPEQAREAFRKGAALAQADLANNSRDGLVRSLLAYLSARLGERSKAESEAVLALQSAPASASVARWVIMTYEALGERSRALDVAETAPDDALRRLKRSPDMADFQNNPRFQQLVQSRHVQ